MIISMSTTIPTSPVYLNQTLSVSGRVCHERQIDMNLQHMLAGFPCSTHSIVPLCWLGCIGMAGMDGLMEGGNNLVHYGFVE